MEEMSKLIWGAILCSQKLGGNGFDFGVRGDDRGQRGLGGLEMREVGRGNALQILFTGGENANGLLKKLGSHQTRLRPPFSFKLHAATRTNTAARPRPSFSIAVIVRLSSTSPSSLLALSNQNRQRPRAARASPRRSSARGHHISRFVLSQQVRVTTGPNSSDSIRARRVRADSLWAKFVCSCIGIKWTIYGSKKYRNLRSLLKAALNQTLFVQFLKGIEFLSSKRFYLRKNIENLEKNSVTSLRTMVNLGSEVYMQAEVPDTQHIFVDVGLGFHVEFTWSEALNFISTREEKLAKQLEEYTRLIASIKAQIKLVCEGIRELLDIPAEKPLPERIF